MDVEIHKAASPSFVSTHDMPGCASTMQSPDAAPDCSSLASADDEHVAVSVSVTAPDTTSYHDKPTEGVLEQEGDASSVVDSLGAAHADVSNSAVVCDVACLDLAPEGAPVTSLRIRPSNSEDATTSAMASSAADEVEHIAVHIAIDDTERIALHIRTGGGETAGTFSKTPVVSQLGQVSTATTAMLSGPVCRTPAFAPCADGTAGGIGVESLCQYR